MSRATYQAKVRHLDARHAYNEAAVLPGWQQQSRFRAARRHHRYVKMQYPKIYGSAITVSLMDEMTIPTRAQRM